MKQSPEEIERKAAYLERISRRSAMAGGISDERLLEICTAEREKRLVVFPTSEIAKNALNEAFSAAFCDLAESEANKDLEAKEAERK